MGNDSLGALNMVEYNLFIGFKDQKAVTLILSKAGNEKDAFDCDYFVVVDDVENIKKNVLMWLEKQNKNVNL